MGVFGSGDPAPLTRDDFYDNASWRRWQQLAGDWEQQVYAEMAAEEAEEERRAADLANYNGPMLNDDAPLSRWTHRDTRLAPEDRATVSPRRR